jgi:putative tail protein
MSDAAGKGGGPTPFVNAFAPPKINSLRYNTSQAGSPIHLGYGTTRVSVNLIEFWGFSGSKGGKGGKGLGNSAGKKGSNQRYSVNVAFGLCQGPVSFAGPSGNLRIWSNGGVATGLGQVGLNGYPGNDGQSPDPVFASADPNRPAAGYSGTAYVTGTPMQLGSSPALPNIQFEIAGVAAGSAGPDFPADAGPDRIVIDLLTNPRYGAGFPVANLDSAGSLADWGNYCQAARLAMSLLLDKQQPGARWLEEIALLTVSAVLWSGTSLKIIPYGDQPLSANGASWAPDLIWQYSLGDGDFLDFGGDSDPVLLTRSDPAHATNWLSVEYLDSGNSYNAQIVAVWDQGLIDAYGLRSEAPIQAHEFTNRTSATVAAQLLLQRKAYIRNTYKFKLGWRYSLLEPMDIVLLTDATLGLDGAAVRILQIDEDDNGELTVTAEEVPGVAP